MTEPKAYLTTAATAPFAMAPIKVMDFGFAKRFSIVDFGAQPGDQKKNTRAIGLAISAAARCGQGVVVVPAGQWLCAAIHFKSNVNLHLHRGATLLFSDNPEDYLPAVNTSWEGIECYNYSPLIYAYQCENIAITGAGVLQASLGVWQHWYERPQPHMDALLKLYQMAASGVPVHYRQMAYKGANLRPHFIQFNRCRHVLVQGVSIRNSPFWVLHPYLCKDVIVRELNIEAHGHNNDGVDPEMTQNMLIEDCVFDQGDDVIAIKSGRDHDARRLNTPSNNIVMRNCRIKNGHHLLALGSELSGGIKNVFIDHCDFEHRKSDNQRFVQNTPDAQGFGNLVYLKTNGYRGGYVHNIHVANITAKNLSGAVVAIDTDVLYQWRGLVAGGKPRLTSIADIFVSNVQAAEVKHLSRIEGDERLPVENVCLKNIKVANIVDKRALNKNINSFSCD